MSGEIAILDEAISDVLAGLDLARPGLALLSAFRPEIALVVAPAFAVYYEELVHIRYELAHERDETRIAMLKSKVDRAMQALAKAKHAPPPTAGFEGIGEEQTGH